MSGGVLLLALTTATDNCHIKRTNVWQCASARSVRTLGPTVGPVKYVQAMAEPPRIYTLFCYIIPSEPEILSQENITTCFIV